MSKASRRNSRHEIDAATIEKQAQESSGSGIDSHSSGAPIVSAIQQRFPLVKEKSRELLNAESIENGLDLNLVSWNGDDDPENPKNWTRRQRRLVLILITIYAIVPPMASTMISPALPQITRDFKIEHDPVASQMMFSAFLLAYVVGPLFLGPLSEVYGRVPVLHIACSFFLVFNLASGFAQNVGQMIAFRFLAGLGGCAPPTIGGGIVADCFRLEERSQAVAIYQLSAVVGPAIGPVAGGFVAQNTTWRWIFWSLTMANFAVQLLGLVLLPETWGPKILEARAKRLRIDTGNEKLVAKDGVGQQTISQKLGTSLQRSFRLLLTQPIIIAFGIYMAYLYGLVWLVISSYSSLFTSPKYYNESLQIASLNYLAIPIGYLIGAQLSVPLNNWVYRALSRRNEGQGRPEFRVPVLLPSAILLPIGSFWYGWSAEARLHWIMPNIGVALLSAATAFGYQAGQTYLIDVYPRYAASALAAVNVLRSIASFAMPLFAPSLYSHLGYGWGNSLLGFVALLLGLPAIGIFWRWGATLRARSQYVSG